MDLDSLETTKMREICEMYEMNRLSKLELDIWYVLQLHSTCIECIVQKTSRKLPSHHRRRTVSFARHFSMLTSPSTDV